MVKLHFLNLYVGLYVFVTVLYINITMSYISIAPSLFQLQ